ncbi:MAG: hypothetical protein EP343_31415 [Deltaproteobacteria bacterium]|nr:MAG: hypothetical protein EP343_31415 [Deltaproteobacteria bacterium]
MHHLRLILARHGEAGRASSGGDVQRPLTQHGHKQASRLATLLSEAGWLPSIVVSSSALRTRETTQNLLDAWSHELQVAWEDSFYLGNLHTIVPTLQHHNLSDCSCLMLVGHNPGWSDAVSQLSGTYVSMGTANAALLSIEAESWDEALLTTYNWTLQDVLRP